MDNANFQQPSPGNSGSANNLPLGQSDFGSLSDYLDPSLADTTQSQAQPAPAGQLGVPATGQYNGDSPAHLDLDRYVKAEPSPSPALAETPPVLSIAQPGKKAGKTVGGTRGRKRKSDTIADDEEEDTTGGRKRTARTRGKK